MAGRHPRRRRDAVPGAEGLEPQAAGVVKARGK
jgi:hypothetical protein